MSRDNLAIALCRVSSFEQLKNNSLATQKGNVLKAAKELKVTIPADGVWEGQVSSKKGVNYNRKDLVQMYDYCKKHSAVKYLIVQEVDRFMRSPDEQTYWYVRFWYELKVRIWFADKPELNEDTHIAALLRYMEGWRAGGSNEERISKSINGHLAGLKAGRYTFVPPSGYMRGQQKGIPEVHPERGPALQRVLINIATKRVTPTQGLKDLNNSDFLSGGRTPLKMDKFRSIATNAFYAGVVEKHKQVNYRNENGLHEPLITLAQHHELVRIFDAKQKNQSGPRKNGNPKFPYSNIVSHDTCLTRKNRGRLVGFDHGNGKNSKLLYEKYRCRSCGEYMLRKDLHAIITQHFNRYSMSTESVDEFIKALNDVWKQREAQSRQDAIRLAQKIKTLKEQIDTRVFAAIEPDNASIKQEIMANVEKLKNEAAKLEEELAKTTIKADEDKNRFLKFAFNFVNNIGSRFTDMSKENRERCKQVIFPAGFYLDENKNVYTPEISPLYRLAVNKKDLSISEKSLMVRVRRL